MTPAEAVMLKVEIGGISGLGLLAMIQPNQELAVIGSCIVGSAMGGFVGVSFSQPKTLRQWAMRWVVNFFAGVPTGLFATAYYSDHFPYIPVTYLGTLVSAIAGPLTVVAIPIAIPVLLDVLKSWLDKKKTQTTNPDPPP